MATYSIQVRRLKIHFFCDLKLLHSVAERCRHREIPGQGGTNPCCDPLSTATVRLASIARRAISTCHVCLASRAKPKPKIDDSARKRLVRPPCPGDTCRERKTHMLPHTRDKRPRPWVEKKKTLMERIAEQRCRNARIVTQNRGDRHYKTQTTTSLDIFPNPSSPDGRRHHFLVFFEGGTRLRDPRQADREARRVGHDGILTYPKAGRLPEAKQATRAGTHRSPQHNTVFCLADPRYLVSPRKVCGPGPGAGSFPAARPSGPRRNR